MIYIVSYDLRKPGQDYADLFEVLKSFPSWWHYLESTWLISTTDSANRVFEKLKPCLDPNDRVLVIGATKDYEGWLEQKAWNWIRDH